MNMVDICLADYQAYYGRDQQSRSVLSPIREWLHPKNKEQLLKGWLDYFNKLLNNRNANVDLAKKPKPSLPLNSIKTAPFTKIEINQTIKEFSRKKSPGPD